MREPLRTMNRKDFELLAPAGSRESLRAAIQAGADAVYFGVEKLNMRARSSQQFRLDELEAVVGLCHEHRVRAYLTLNVIVYDHELDEVRRIIDRARDAGIDAIIATDMAVIAYARSAGLEVHLSTQVNISNIETVIFFSGLADVMVLARELSLEQVKNLHRLMEEQNILGPSGKPVRLEIFVHGALCMAVSGKCYLSLHEMDSSANRGKCLQTCRKPYTVINRETGYELDVDHEYIMSPKDLMTIHFLNKILDAGVRVLKIEGRARGPEYVKTVTACYNEALDAYCQGDYSEEKIRLWKERLATVFNRGFWDGYYLGQKLGEWSGRYGSRATMRKIRVGKVSNYYTKLRVVEVRLESGALRNNEKVLFIGHTTGVVETFVKGLRVDDMAVEEASKGMICTFRVDEPLRRSDQVYRWVEARFVMQQ